MNAPDADRARRVGAGLVEDCRDRIAPAADDREPRRLAELLGEVAELLTADLPDLATCQDWEWRLVMAGYNLRGLHCCAATFAEGRQEADDEWTATTVAACQAGRGAVEAAAARRRRTAYGTTAQTPEQVAARARSSWGRVERAIEPDPRKREAAERAAAAARWRTDRRPAEGQRAG